VRGCLDSGSFASVLHLVNSIDVQDAHSLTIDLQGITFMDAAGLRVLMTLRQRTRACGCQLIVSRPSQPVLKLLRLCGLERSFEFETERTVQVRGHQSAA
jgi:anti-anti-sigma factor